MEKHPSDKIKTTEYNLEMLTPLDMVADNPLSPLYPDHETLSETPSTAPDNIGSLDGRAENTRGAENDYEESSSTIRNIGTTVLAGAGVYAATHGLDVTSTKHQGEYISHHVVSAANISFLGLKRLLVAKRYEQSVQRTSKFDVKADVYKEVAAAVLDNRVPQPNLRPITKQEIRQSKRAERRLRKNMSQAAVNYNLSQVYGRDTVLGSKEYFEDTATERLSRIEKKSKVNAGETYNKNIRITNKRIGKIQKSARGQDIPGQIIRNRADQNLQRAERLAQHVRYLEQLEQQRRQNSERLKKRLRRST